MQSSKVSTSLRPSCHFDLVREDVHKRNLLVIVALDVTLLRVVL
jgi:hypothetical protein